jgi:serine/threonine protein kinase
MNELSSEKVDVVDQVTDSFVGELRAGRRPNIEDYLRRYPDLAEQLAELLPAIALLEQHAAICNLRSLDQSQAALPSHQEIGEFTIVREIGRGGMGVVYEAMQMSLGRHVALKVLSMPTLLNAKHLERFRFEARAAARLQHRNIVPVFGVGEFNGLHYYAMQFIHGKSLHEVLYALRQLSRPASPNNESPHRGELTNAVVAKLVPQEGPSSIDQRGPHHPPTEIPKTQDFYRNVARIGLQVTEALAYAHSEGVLHRDIKPSNLLLDASGNVWVTDFGLAKTEGTEDLTETGDFVGTLRYMAPERLEGVLDRRSDIYSLGATLYELLTLQSFFETNSHARLVDQILHESPPAPSRFERSIPRDLETIVLKAIAKEPALRYRTAEEMAEDLRCFLADRPILSRRPSAREQLVRWCRRNPLVATLATTIAVLLLAAIVILTRSNARIRSEVVAKDKALESAHHVVHQLLARVANEKLDNVPMSHPLRVELLEDAVKAYEDLLAQGDTGLNVRQQMADVLHSIAGLERELGRDADAESALKRSAKLYESLIATDANQLALREALGMVQADLAYTWQFDIRSPDFKTFPIESQYRQALATFDAIEHEWPQRRQPVTMCIRYLADVANHRGDRVQAEQLWREAISRGESYLKDQPKHLQARNDVCWACQEYYEAILSNSPNRTDDANTILAKGVQHAEEMRRQQPDAVQAVDVLASLHFRQALVCCRAGRIDDAIPIFHTAFQEVEYLCDSVPWNTDYWNTAQWFHEESIENLHKANRDDEIDALVEQTSAWLQKLRAKVANDARSRQKIEETQTALIKVLRKFGRDHQADEFARIAN